MYVTGVRKFPYFTVDTQYGAVRTFLMPTDLLVTANVQTRNFCKSYDVL